MLRPAVARLLDARTWLARDHEGELHVKTPFVHRVAIRNCGSRAACQLDLESLVFLVGRNSAGTSNFPDALFEHQ